MAKEIDDSPKGIALLIHAGPKKPMDDEQGDDGAPPDGLEDAMERLCEAEEAKDYKAMAAAFWDAFSLCDASPHGEGPHEDMGEADEGEESGG